MTSLPVLDAKSGQLSEAERAAIARDLANQVEGEVRFGRHDRMLYSTDASLYQVEPIGVVVPSSVDDAQRAVTFCAERGLAMLPRGGGTSLAGQCTNRAVVIDAGPGCRGVLAVDGEGRRCRVEPGISIDELNVALQGTGLFFAPDPATSKHANIGGCIGNNAAGSRSVKYGRVSENLIGIDACLADGTRVWLGPGASDDPKVGGLRRGVADVVQRHAGLIRERFPKTIRRNAGYNLDLMLGQLERGEELNLAHLLCGSEGTLALTLGAELVLHPRPSATGLGVVAFASVDAAIAAVQAILETGPSAVELLDDMVLSLARANSEYRKYAELMPGASEGLTPQGVLYVEYHESEGGPSLDDSFAALRACSGGGAMETYRDASSMGRAWKLRKAGEPLLHGIPGNRKPISFVEDNAVPVEHLGEFVRRFREIVEREGTKAAFFAHASVGVLHVRPLLDLKDDADVERMHRIAVEAAELAQSLGGVMSGEHGDGRVRTPLLERFYGTELMGAMREIKAIFDPRGLMNPGNIVEARAIETISQRTRIAPGEGRVAVPETETYYRYEKEHGFGGAVEMCNGAGVCRKRSGGVMCPSYMGTLDERHSTRGRGNALRLAITGQFGGSRSVADWDDAETKATLDLCLSCKACKSECPSNVDVARLKSEYLAQGYRREGAPLATRVMGHVRIVNRLGSIVPGLANAGAQSWIGRKVAEHVLGVSPKRDLPAFARPLWKDVRARTLADVPDDGAPVVVLFPDCFTVYNEPWIGRAAARVMERLGYHVVLPKVGCCGRSMVSLGLLDDAVATIGRTAEGLAVFADSERVAGILVCEPSCLSAMTDDWLELKLGSADAAARRVAAKAISPEQFVEAQWEDHPTRVEPRGIEGPVVYHGHCHQKALIGAEASAGALSRMTDALSIPDTTCCGMAGAFGYAAHRYEVSMEIGELSVFPVAREAAAARALMVAAGTSCRHQIRDGAGVEALHPIEVIDRGLGGSPQRHNDTER